MKAMRCRASPSFSSTAKRWFSTSIRSQTAAAPSALQALKFLDGDLPGYAANLRSQNCNPQVRKSLTLPSTLDGLVVDGSAASSDVAGLKRAFAWVRKMLSPPPAVVSGKPPPCVPMSSFPDVASGSTRRRPLLGAGSSAAGRERDSASQVNSPTAVMLVTGENKNGDQSLVAKTTHGNQGELALAETSAAPAVPLATQLNNALSMCASSDEARLLTQQLTCDLVPRQSPESTGAFGYPRHGVLPEQLAFKFPNLIVDPVRPTDPLNVKKTTQIYLSSRLHASEKPVFLTVYSGGGALSGVATGAEPWRRVCARASAAGAGSAVSFVTLHLSDSWVGRRLAGGVTKVFLRKRLDYKNAEEKENSASLEVGDAYVYRGRWRDDVERLLGPDHRQLPTFFLIDSRGLIRWQAHGIPTPEAEEALTSAIGSARKQLWGSGKGAGSGERKGSGLSADDSVPWYRSRTRASWLT